MYLQGQVRSKRYIRRIGPLLLLLPHPAGFLAWQLPTHYVTGPICTLYLFCVKCYSVLCAFRQSITPYFNSESRLGHVLRTM